MTKCKQSAAKWKRLQRREVAVDFEGGRLTSDAGLLLLRIRPVNDGLGARGTLAGLGLTMPDQEANDGAGLDERAGVTERFKRYQR